MGETFIYAKKPDTRHLKKWHCHLRFAQNGQACSDVRGVLSLAVFNGISVVACQAFFLLRGRYRLDIDIEN